MITSITQNVQWYHDNLFKFFGPNTKGITAGHDRHYHVFGFGPPDQVLTSRTTDYFTLYMPINNIKENYKTSSEDKHVPNPTVTVKHYHNTTVTVKHDPNPTVTVKHDHNTNVTGKHDHNTNDTVRE